MIELAGIKAFFTTWWKVGAAFLLGCALTAPLAYCEGKSAAEAKAKAARAEANVEAMKTNAKASEAAASERLHDALTVDKREEELLDAIQDTPDTAPDAVRVRLGCERLRQAGKDTAAIPACR